ncbi:MAG: hypothetical protein QW292_12590 [Candidatus Parvarchaeota archaeon]
MAVTCTLFSKYERGEKAELFFSTTWCRDRLFTSGNPEDILRVYDSFQDREEVVEWMRGRPRGRADIIEVEGDKDVIVVIPTADFNNQYAKECRENVYKGLHIIFVQSGLPRDPYFNIAHNFNLGIRKAMEYNPKWIVISNDDVVKKDEPEKLVHELSQLDCEKVDAVFTQPAGYHSAPAFIGQPNMLYDVTIRVFKHFSKNVEYVSRFYEDMKRLNENVYFLRFTYGISLKRKITDLFLFKKRLYFLNTASFMIVSRKFVRNNEKVFDETYINDMEDTELSLRVRNMNCAFIDYDIGEYVGSSLGTGVVRFIRMLPSLTYFSQEIDTGHIVGFKTL